MKIKKIAICPRFIDQHWHEMSPSESHLLMVLARHMWKDTRACFPGLDRLIAITGMSKNTVTAARKKLIKKGWVETWRDTESDGRFAKTKYRIKQKMISIIFIEIVSLDEITAVEEPEKTPQKTTPKTSKNTSKNTPKSGGQKLVHGGQKSGGQNLTSQGVKNSPLIKPSILIKPSNPISPYQKFLSENTKQQIQRAIGKAHFPHFVNHPDLEKLSDEKFRALVEWLEYRTEKKKPLASKTFNSLIKRFLTHSTDEVVWLIDYVTENGWQGLKWDEYLSKRTRQAPVIALRPGFTRKNQKELEREIVDYFKSTDGVSYSGMIKDVGLKVSLSEAMDILASFSCWYFGKHEVSQLPIEKIVSSLQSWLFREKKNLLRHG